MSNPRIFPKKVRCEVTLYRRVIRSLLYTEASWDHVGVLNQVSSWSWGRHGYLLRHVTATTTTLMHDGLEILVQEPSTDLLVVKEWHGVLFVARLPRPTCLKRLILELKVPTHVTGIRLHKLRPSFWSEIDWPVRSVKLWCVAGVLASPSFLLLTYISHVLSLLRE